MRLIDALRYSPGTNLVFVGAGGKTSALFRVARELLAITTAKSTPRSILVTTTTHFGTWQKRLSDQVIWLRSKTDLANLEQDFPEGVILLLGEENNDRISGLRPDLLESLHVIAEKHQLPLLIEADGAHTLPLKAPAHFEPAIPEFARHVIVVAGLTGLGKPLSESWVHRPEVFARLSGLHPGETVTSQAIVEVMRHKEGGLKNIPPASRKTILLNQADSVELQNQARDFSGQLIPDFDSVIIASLFRGAKLVQPEEGSEAGYQGDIHAVIEQVAGVILAAGGSSRFGQPKQLLLWKGRPIIRHIALSALEAGLSPVVVVVGASAGEVEGALSDLPVRIANNNKWVEGLSSSIKAGIAYLPDKVGGALFLQADQPQVSLTLIKELIDRHQKTLAPIVAPQIDGQRGNPVLFDACTFKDLLALTGDIGGRALFSSFPVHWVSFDDPNLFLDIDTPEDYQKLLDLYSGGEVNP